MSIKNWQTQDQPREKLLQQGVEHLSDAELLAILLRTGTRGMDAVSLAQQILQHFGSLRAVFMADAETLQKYKGIGTSAVTQFAVVREIGKRLLREEMSQLPQINDPQSMEAYLRMHIGFEAVEIMLAFFLDRQNRILTIEELSRGTISENTVYIREVVHRALQHHATALIIAHNHPAGSLQASTDDRIFTTRLKAALHLFDITLLDHLIVTPNQVVSFLANGWIKP
ncbi:MAG: DNA repair protein RadC [Neisseriaceae bacterium]|nr:DNA repair protein RadC [Neisseriaceae bacterium]